MIMRLSTSHHEYALVKPKPQLFEALVFLKVNERYWDAQLVSKAIYAARGDRAEARLRGNEEHMAQNV